MPRVVCSTVIKSQAPERGFGRGVPAKKRERGVGEEMNNNNPQERREEREERGGQERGGGDGGLLDYVLTWLTGFPYVLHSPAAELCKTCGKQVTCDCKPIYTP